VSGTPADTIAPAAVRDLSLGPQGSMSFAVAELEEHRAFDF
jgi:hypothetical protein